MPTNGPSRKFYRRYAAFVALGITPDATTWVVLKGKVAEAKVEDTVRRGVIRFEKMTSQEVMNWAHHAVKNGIKDFPKPGEMPTNVERNPESKGEPRARKPVAAKPAKTMPVGDTANFLRDVKKMLNGTGAAK